MNIKKSRWFYFPQLFKAMGYKLGAEIGVEVGAFSKYLIQNNPDLTLYSIDSWTAYRDIANGRSQARQDVNYEKAKEKLAPYKNCIVVKKSSMEAIKDFEDESLDFVYIDASHDYSYVKDDIREWSKKVRKGGIVAGHDYFIFPSGNDGVFRAVNEWVKENNIDLIEVNDYKRAPSWYYIK